MVGIWLANERQRNSWKSIRPRRQTQWQGSQGACYGRARRVRVWLDFRLPALGPRRPRYTCFWPVPFNEMAVSSRMYVCEKDCPTKGILIFSAVSAKRGNRNLYLNLDLLGSFFFNFSGFDVGTSCFLFWCTYVSFKCNMARISTDSWMAFAEGLAVV